MRVVFHHSHFYDWAPVPPDVEVTEADIKAGRVKPNARDDGHLMQVTRKVDTHTVACISEAEIIERIIHNAMPQYGGALLSRKEAVHDELAKMTMPQHAHPKHLRAFEVHDDGPDEALCRKMLTPFLTALHPRTGEPCLDAEQLEAMVARYLEPAAAKDHEDHLHAKFGVRKAG